MYNNALHSRTRLTYTDDSIRHGMCMVVIHVLLLLVNLSECFKPKLLLWGKLQAGLQHGFNNVKVSASDLVAVRKYTMRDGSNGRRSSS